MSTLHSFPCTVMWLHLWIFEPQLYGHVFMSNSIWNNQVCETNVASNNHIHSHITYLTHFNPVHLATGRTNYRSLFRMYSVLAQFLSFPLHVFIQFQTKWTDLFITTTQQPGVTSCEQHCSVIKYTYIYNKYKMY